MALLVINPKVAQADTDHVAFLRMKGDQDQRLQSQSFDSFDQSFNHCISSVAEWLAGWTQLSY
jgi:hypothetical protein